MCYCLLLDTSGVRDTETRRVATLASSVSSPAPDTGPPSVLFINCINQVLSMFQNGLQIHFQTLRRRCDLFILQLQFYIVIIVSITIY